MPRLSTNLKNNLSTTQTRDEGVGQKNKTTNLGVLHNRADTRLGLLKIMVLDTDKQGISLGDGGGKEMTRPSCPKCYSRLTENVAGTYWLCPSPICDYTAPIQPKVPRPELIVTINRVEGHGGGHRGRHRSDTRQVDTEGYPDPYQDE